MSLKVLIILSLIAAAACSPTALLVKGHHKAGGSAEGKAVGIGGILNGVFGVIKGVSNKATGAVERIANSAFGSLVDVIDILLNMCLVLQVTLNNLVAGLGSLFIRLVAVIIKIAFCVLGLPGDRGVCAKGWNAKFGIEGELSTGATVEACIKLFGVEEAQSELNGYINTISGGKGIQSLSTKGSIYITLNQMNSLCGYITNYKKISKETVTETFVIMTTITAAISNSRKTNSGTEIIDDLVKKCSPHFKQSGYSDITVQASVIENTCSSANGDNVDWDGNNNGGSTESNTGGNTKGSTESSTSGSTGSKTEGSTEGNTGGSTEGSTGSSTGKNTGDNTGVSVGVNLGLGEVLNGIFKVINGVANTALSALDACVNIVIRTLKDVFDVVGNLILVLQVALNNLVSGLGSLFVRLVACIIKIAVCVLGLPGDSAVRAKGWNARFGVEGELSVDATAEAYVKLFGLVNAKAELDGYIKIISGGKEIEKTSGSINIVLNRVNTLCDYITNYKQISKETVTQTFVIMTTVAASISNSRKTNSGTEIIDNLVNKCGPYFKQSGYQDITVDVTVIKESCSKANGDNVDWNGNGNNGGSTGGSTEGNTGGNTKGSTEGSTEGNTGGNTKGSTEGNTGGNTKGSTESSTEGNTKGSTEGSTEGNTGGTTKGSTEGNTGGTTKGSTEGNTGGNTKGSTEGNTGGTTKGSTEGNTGGNTKGSTESSTEGNTGGNTKGSTESSTEGNTKSSTEGSTGGSTGGSDTITGNNCGQAVGGAIKEIPGVDQNIITTLINLKVQAFTDVINLVVNITLALGNVIDAVISGLGSILVRIVAVITKISCCVNGKGSDKSICTKDWNAKFGITGEATTSVDLIALFRVNNCKSDVETIISTYTKANGSAKGLAKVLIQMVTDLTNIVSSGSITEEAFTTVSINIFSIFGTITDSYQAGSGTAIVQQVVPICSTFLVKEGFVSIKESLSTIISTINVGTNVKFDWSIVTNVKDKLTTEVKKVFKSVKSSSSSPSLTAILNLRPSQCFDDVLSFGVQVVQALSSVLDVFIKGLGSLIARMVGCLINYIVAVLGAARNSKSFVAQKAFFVSFGVSVSGSTWADIAAGFKVDSAKADLDVILNAYTDNKGLKSLAGARLVIFNCAYSLADICGKGTSIVEADLTAVFRLVTTLLGGFANSLSANVGKTICDNLLPTTSYYLEQNGYSSFSSSVTGSIYEDISTCNNVAVPWSGSASVGN